MNEPVPKKVRKFAAILLLIGATMIASLGGLELARAAKYSVSLNISENGVVSAKGIEVAQVVGNSFLSRARWESTFIRLIVRTNDKTVFTRRFGGTSSASEVKVGDLINIEGELQSGADDLSINAVSVINLSMENEAGNFSGRVKTVDAAGRTFTLIIENGLVLTVRLNTDTSIIKGKIGIPLSELKADDRIVRVNGIYHQPSQTITASAIEVYQDRSVFIPKNFQGTLKTLAGTALPTTMVVTVSGKDYLVYLNERAAVLNKKRAPTSLKRFVAGDTVRFYGAVRETDLTAVDTDTVRDIDL